MIKRTLLWAAFVSSGCGAAAAHGPDTVLTAKQSAGNSATSTPAPAPPADLHNDDERALWVLGQMLGAQLDEMSLTPAELAIVQRGLSDHGAGVRPPADTTPYANRLRELARSRQALHSVDARRQGQAFVDQAAREPGAVRLPSGVVYRETRAGSGPQATADDQVTVNYRGRLIDGTEFDSSYGHGEPVTFALRAVIPCWTEAVQRMRAGGAARLVCPADSAYGDRAQHTIPAGSTLVFDVELIRIEHPAARGTRP